MSDWVVVRVLVVHHSDPRQTGRVVTGGLVAHSEGLDGLGQSCKV